jgi:tRNA-2-methylthio-N6-dimethylallyladenosine synthase
VRKVYVHTFGCQMNESDSDRMVEALAGQAWSRTPHPEDADLILLNTCSVRDKAEQKLLSALGRYREHKARRGALIAVGGCVAQQEKERLLRRVPYVDFVFGPDHGRSASWRPAGWTRRITSSLAPTPRRPAGEPAPSSPP